MRASLQTAVTVAATLLLLWLAAWLISIVGAAATVNGTAIPPVLPVRCPTTGFVEMAEPDSIFWTCRHCRSIHLTGETEYRP